MASVLCTLFEGDYHKGLATLVNSLCAFGFEGTIWAGYRGSLPPWAVPLSSEPEFKKYEVSERCRIHFVKLQADCHLTYLKPDFMLQVLDLEPGEKSAVFYFDPDIVVQRSWSQFEEWASCGVALCEDILSPAHSTSPQRRVWRTTYEPHGFSFANDSLDVYVNGGFVGIAQPYLGFLAEWKRIKELLPTVVAGLQEMIVGEFGSPFYIPDQDALNIAMLNTSHPISLRNKQTMGFETGRPMMFHAIGLAKPWRKCMFLSALKGNVPFNLDADSRFLKYSNAPIRLYSPSQLFLRRLDSALTKAVSILAPQRGIFTRF